MKDKIALVTGGMGGIGAAICQNFSKNGAHVIATYNRNGDHEAANKCQREQRQLGYDVDIHYVDVSNFDSCKQMVEVIVNKYGATPILVNNARNTRDVP